jgi:hypothetical protein
MHGGDTIASVPGQTQHSCVWNSISRAKFRLAGNTHHHGGRRRASVSKPERRQAPFGNPSLAAEYSIENSQPYHVRSGSTARWSLLLSVAGTGRSAADRPCAPPYSVSSVGFIVAWERVIGKSPREAVGRDGRARRTRKVGNNNLVISRFLRLAVQDKARGCRAFAV